jgi:CheY-like chemotaxis protein
MSRELSRILCAEDEADIGTVARMALEAVGGFTVEVCASGEAALETAPAFAPDLILLDVMMPGMDGPATLDALRRRPELAATPVVFMTAKALSSEVERYMALGVLGVIAKPFDPMTLAARVWDKWDVLRG